MFFKCTETCPENSDHWENLGVALMRAGNFNRAGYVYCLDSPGSDRHQTPKRKPPGLGRTGGAKIAYDSAATVLRTALRLATRDARTKDVESIQFHLNLVQTNRR